MCNIIIEKIVSPEDNTIVVSGKVSDCEIDGIDGGHLSVSITCGKNSEVKNAQVFADGRWFAVFNSICQCDEQVRVTATCATDSTCQASLTVDKLPCIKCPEIIFKNVETTDDVFQISFDVKCLDNGNANVTFQYTLTNDFQFPITVEIDCGVGGSPVSGTSVTFPPGTTNTVDVTCKYPSPFLPQILVGFLSNGELLGCAPILVGGPSIDQCPACQKELPTFEVKVEGCTATFTGNFVSPDCTFVFNLDEPNFNMVPKNSLNFSHVYSGNGDYNVGATMKCGDCIYTLSGVNFSIVDCEGNGDDDPDDKPPTNPKFCGVLRSIMAVAAGLALFFGVMIICLPAAWLAFAIAAGVSAFVSLVAGILYFFLCDNKPCNLALLSSAQAALAAGSMLIIYHQCCPWVFWAGLAVLASGIGLLLLWKSKCKKSNCETATEVAYVFAVIIPAIGTVLLSMLVLEPCHSLLANTILALIYGFITGYALDCDD